MPFAAIWMDLEIIMGFPGGSVVKNLPTMQKMVASVPELGRSCGDGNGNLLHYTCLRNPRQQEPGRLQSKEVTKDLDTT